MEKPSREPVSDKCLQVYKYQTKQNISLHHSMAIEKPYSSVRLLFLCWQYICVLDPRKCSAKRCLLGDAWHAAGSGIIVWVMAMLRGQCQFLWWVSALWQQLAQSFSSLTRILGEQTSSQRSSTAVLAYLLLQGKTMKISKRQELNSHSDQKLEIRTW